MRILWENALKQNLERADYICELHFADKDIRRSEKIKLPDDTMMEIPFKRYLLTTDAVPVPLEQSADQSEVNKTL